MKTRTTWRWWDPLARHVTRRILAVSAVMTVTAVAVLLLVDTAPHPSPVRLDWWHIAVGFFLIELWHIDIEGKRGHVHSVNVCEVLIIPTVVFAGPGAAVLGRYVGGLAAWLMPPGDRHPTKWAANTGMWLWEMVAAVTVYRLVLGTSDPTGPLGWTAASLSMLAAFLMSTGSMVVFLTIIEGGDRTRPDRKFDLAYWRWMIPLSASVSLIAGAIGVLAVIVVWYDPRALVILGALVGVVMWGHRRHQRTMQINRDLRGLSDALRSVLTVRRVDQVAERLLTGALKILRAQEAALIVENANQDGSPLFIVLTDNAIIERHLSPNEANELINAIRAGDRPVPGWETQGQSITAPIEHYQRVIGLMAVTGRTKKETGRFEEADQDILASMAVQAGLQLERVRLLATLTKEVSERRSQATHDPVTGAYSEQGLREHLAAVTATEVVEPFGVLSVQITTQREVGIMYGYEMARELLRGAYRRIQRVAPGSVIARIGTEEFVVVTPAGTDPVAVNDLASQLTQHLREPVVVNSVALPTNTRIGIACYPSDADTPDEIVRRSEIALQAAVQSGSAMERYDAEDDPSSGRRLAIAASLGAAMEHGHVALNYQPKMHLATGQVIGAEALLRWADPTLGLVEPAEIIDAAERTGEIHVLTRWVIEQAVKQAAHWRARGLDLNVAVNVSTMNLLDHSLIDTVRRSLTSFQVPAESLTVEITESAVLSDSPRTQRTLNDLDELGVRIAIDDFGTGYSSLAHLRKLPVTEVKIDKQFVFSVAHDESDRMFVEAIAGLAGNLGIDVTAEGVETPAAERILRDAGCTLGQGYLYSRPVPADQFERWLAKQSYPRVARSQVVPFTALRGRGPTT